MSKIMMFLSNLEHMSSEPGALLPVNKKEIGFGVIQYKVQIPAHQLCDLGCVKVYDAKLVFSL